MGDPIRKIFYVPAVIPYRNFTVRLENLEVAITFFPGSLLASRGPWQVSELTRTFLAVVTICKKGGDSIWNPKQC